MAVDVAKGPAIERIARVLAGQKLSMNGHGAGASVSAEVDATWREHLDDAAAVLRTLREPDEVMARAGDPAVWERMVRAAIEQEA